MKTKLSFLIFSISLSVCAQSIEHSGTYTLKLGGSKHFELTELILNPNGTFLFHFYDFRENGIPKERNKFGKGTWTSRDKLIFLHTGPNDVDESHELDFNNSKARFDTRSPRDKSKREIKTSIRFYDSDINWIKGRIVFRL